jgi:hypothetical protein
MYWQKLTLCNFWVVAGGPSVTHPPKLLAAVSTSTQLAHAHAAQRIDDVVSVTKDIEMHPLMHDSILEGGQTLQVGRLFDWTIPLVGENKILVVESRFSGKVIDTRDKQQVLVGGNRCS